MQRSGYRRFNWGQIPINHNKGSNGLLMKPQRGGNHVKRGLAILGNYLNVVHSYTCPLAPILMKDLFRVLLLDLPKDLRTS